MITKGTAFLSRLRRWLSPTEWFVRWFRLPHDETQSHDRGLVMIQIDGLSRQELHRAIDEGRMPFLHSLVEREHYVVHDLYSGLPASTPSFQGELFYGTKCAVPAFGFRDHRNGKVVRMFAQDITSDVEKRLSREQRGLLQGGTAYCNIYGGGAEEAHFCASSMGWSELMRGVSNWKLIPFLFWHAWSILRVAALLVVELVLACIGFLKGALTKHEYWQELLMIPARVVVAILMRELAVIGATMDVTRGVPIVHLNLLGYDEQAHRRGPSSRFAHWTLKGIDHAMRRQWRAAHLSARREYDVWIYSDHGQVATTAFEYVTGQPIGAIASEVIEQIAPANAQSQLATETQRPQTDLAVKAANSRANWLSTGWIVSRLFGESNQDLQGGNNGVQVAALGPLGLIYANRELSTEQRFEISEELVERGVPLAFVATSEATFAVTFEGRFNLKEEPERVFGKDHPFLSEIAGDADLLCHHPDAGDIVVSGWVRDGNSLSFAVQSGAHAGPSPEETNAFVMAPRDVGLESEKGFLRPNDLRLAAERVLHPEPPQLANNGWSQPFHQLRVMTYNVHGCVGMDERLDVRRIARVISQSQADIVSLQELDVRRARSGFRDQAEEIARMLEMQCRFHPAWQLEEEHYGDAILSRIPFRTVRVGQLPSKSTRHEPRGAIWVEAELEPGSIVQIINTHLSIYPTERHQQAQSVADDWVRPAKEMGTTIVCGDFNATPSSASYRALNQLTRDVQKYGVRRKASPTFFSPRPVARIDHIFVTDDVGVQDAHVMDTRLARVSSDHLPLVADLVVRKTPNSTTGLSTSSNRDINAVGQTSSETKITHPF